MSLQNLLKTLERCIRIPMRNKQNIHFLCFELFSLHFGLDTANVLPLDPLVFSYHIRL